jgi:hypothetical protein
VRLIHAGAPTPLQRAGSAWWLQIGVVAESYRTRFPRTVFSPPEPQLVDAALAVALWHVPGNVIIWSTHRIAVAYRVSPGGVAAQIASVGQDMA